MHWPKGRRVNTYHPQERGRDKRNLDAASPQACLEGGHLSPGQGKQGGSWASPESSLGLPSYESIRPGTAGTPPWNTTDAGTQVGKSSLKTHTSSEGFFVEEAWGCSVWFLPTPQSWSPRGRGVVGETHFGSTTGASGCRLDCLRRKVAWDGVWSDHPPSRSGEGVPEGAGRCQLSRVCAIPDLERPPLRLRAGRCLTNPSAVTGCFSVLGSQSPDRSPFFIQLDGRVPAGV